MKNVFIVGPCYADAQSLKKSLQSRFSINVLEATRAEEAKNILRQRKIDLVLVSRVLAGDKSSGLTLLGYLKKINPKLPVMILTRFPEAQKEALASGAVAAFDIDLFIGYIRPSMEEKEKEAIKQIKKYLN